MKYFKLTVFFFIFLAAGVMFTSCGDDMEPDDGGDPECNWVTEIDSEFQTLFSAERAYEDDASADNCRALETALMEYIDAANDLEDCARDAGVFQDYKIALDDAVADLNGLNCM